MQRSEIRDRARKKLGETTAAFWTNEELNGYINDGCRDLSFRTKSIKANTYLTTADCAQNESGAAATEVTLTSIDPALYSVEQVYFLVDGTQWVRLKPYERDAMDIDYPGWRDAIGRTYVDGPTTYYNYGSMPGTPILYYWDREEDLFGWWLPTDSTQSNSNNMRIYFTKRHTDLTGDTQEPQLPEPLTNAIIDYVIATGLEDRGWGDKANDRWNKYFKKIEDYRIETSRERTDEDTESRNYRNI